MNTLRGAPFTDGLEFNSEETMQRANQKKKSKNTIVPSTICTISDELAFEGPSTYDAEPSLIDLNNPFGFFFEKLKIMAQPKDMWPIGLCNCEAENNLLAERLLKRLGSEENGESNRLEHVELKIDENFGKTKKGMIKQGTNKTLKDEL